MSDTKIGAPSTPAREAAKEIVEFCREYEKDGGKIGHPANNGLCIFADIIQRHFPSREPQGALAFSDLRAANLSRCARWHPRGLSEWSLSDWGVATAGEMGEALNVIKKLNRERDGIAGNSASIAELKVQLEDEIADVAIYLDILAASEGIDLAASIVKKFNRTSEKVGFPERLALASRDRELREMREALRELAIQAKRQVEHHGHLCGYGNFPAELAQHDECAYCEPTMKAVARAERVREQKEGK